MKLFFNKKKLPEKVEKILFPRPEFTRSLRNTFLAAFLAKFPYTKKRTSLWVVLLRAGVAAILFLSTLGIASVYADTANVGPENPLYPLKRSHEFLEAAFSRKEDQPKFHLRFAKRRLGEIQELKATHPTSTKIIELENNFQEDVRISVTRLSEDAFPKTSYPNEKIKKFCTSLEDLFENSSTAVGDLKRDHPSTFKRYTKKCFPVLGKPLPDEQKAEPNSGNE